MSLSTTQYGYIVDPMVPFTDDKGKTIKNGFIRVFMAGTSTPVITYRNYDGATNQEKIELDNSGRVKHNVIGSKGSLYKVVVYNILHSQENPLLTVDKIAVLGASVTGTTVVTGLDSVTVQEENFIKATVEGTGVELALDPTEVTSEVSTIGAAETAAPDYVLPLLDKTGTGDCKKISLANLFKFALDWISRLATTVTSFASGDFIAVSNTTDGTRKMPKDTLLQLTAQNALAGNVAPAFDPTRTSENPYEAGNIVTYQNSIKRFKREHYGAWVDADADDFDIGSLIDFLYQESNPEYAALINDADDKLLCGITRDGILNVFTKIQFHNEAVGAVALDVMEEQTDAEFVYRIDDVNGNYVFGIDKNGQIKFACGVPVYIQRFVKKCFSDYSISNYECGGYGPTSWTVLGKLCGGARHNYCAAFGYRVLENNTGIKNVTMGSDNMCNASGDDNTSMGYHSQFRLTSGNRNTSNGSESQDDVTSGNANTSSGFCSLQRNNKGDNNAAFGAYALQGIYENSYDPDNLKEFNNNVAVGACALQNCENLSEDNVAVGKDALKTQRKYVNCIGIGKGAECEEDNMTSIGNSDTEKTRVFGDFIVKGTDGISRQVVFNQDGTCSWVALT